MIKNFIIVLTAAFLGVLAGYNYGSRIKDIATSHIERILK